MSALEATPFLQAQGPIKWTGSSIVRLSLHRRAAFHARLDVLPFAALYVTLLIYVVSSKISMFFTVAMFTTAVILHVLSFLAQHWSVRLRAAVSWKVVQRIEVRHVREGVLYALLEPRKHRGKAEMVKLSADCDGRVFFTFQKRTYEYNAGKNCFEKVEYPTQFPVEFYMGVARRTNGLCGNHLLHAAERFGSNRLDMPAPTFMELYVESLLAPFFVFQVFCVFLWLLDEYWKYSLLTLGMMLVFEATVVFGRLRSLRELRGMRNPSLAVHVFRDRKWIAIQSFELLPGDIISIGRGKDASHVVPCDLLILSGNAVVNESMLTGESVPLMKEALAPLDEADERTPLSIRERHKSHVLFGGTRILSHTPGVVCNATPAPKAPDNGIICYVLRTGFGSSQGKLMRTILFSTESVSANSLEAALFILFLLVFAIAASGYVLYHTYTDEPGARYKLLLRCVLIITSVVPPELPMQLALAVNTSLVALVKNMIFCTEPYRIPYAGKIDICCFDKTGTLTTDSINAAGVAMPPSPYPGTKQAAPADGYTLVPVPKASTDACLVLAACHSLVHVENELIGDPLEIAALEAVEWNYGKSGTAVPKRGGASTAFGKILQRYRFASSLQRMSVIAEVGGGSVRAGARVLVKGSPEAVGDLLAGGVLPDVYTETARRLARGGMRVLAMAYKELDTGLTGSELSKMKREEAESELTFVGFACFECPLRSDSRKVIRSLKRANHLVSMITGDATLTAAHVATQVEMCTKSVLILDKSEVNLGTLEWFSANSGKRKKRYAADSIPELSKDFDLCVAGPALRMAIETNRDVRRNLKYIKVFARMSPDQKEDVLNALKEEGLFTLMCGDGTNDVGALKQAHVGVALLSSTVSQSQTAASKGRGERDNGQSEVLCSKKGGVAAKSHKSMPNIRQRKKSGSGSPIREIPDRDNKTAALGRPKTAREIQQEAYSKKMDELTSSLGESDDQPPLVKLGDASIASPFTSRRMTIDACASIIRQGRCTLATTLQMYQILALNCLISAYSLSVLHLQGVVFGDYQMTIVGFVLAVASFMVSRSKPLKKLSPQRPASSVFALEMFTSLLGQFAVHLAALIGCMKIVEPYLPADHTPNIDEDFTPSLTNSVVFLITIAQQISVYALNYKGRPHMQGITDNKPLLHSLMAAAVLLLVCTLQVIPPLNEYMELTPWPSTDLQMKLTGLILFDVFGAFVADRVAMRLFAPRVKLVE